MANDLYRGYEIKPIDGGFYWTDERNFDHFEGQATRTPYKTSDKAMDDIDRYKRAMRGA